MVYLRVPTAVFYIIQAIGFSTLQHSASARQHFSLSQCLLQLIVSHVTLRSKAQVATPLLLDFRYLL
jgi:hypothetical protein